MAVLVVVGLAGSLAAKEAVERIQQRHAEQLMDQHADEVTQEVSEELDSYRDALSDVAVAVGAQSHFTGDDFTEITSRLSRQRLPGASGVSFAVSADNDQVDGVEAAWRALGASGLTLNAVGAGRERMFMIFYRSMDAFPDAPGRDLSQVPEAADALRMSRASGQVTVSQAYILLKDRGLPAAQRQMSFELPP